MEPAGGTTHTSSLPCTAARQGDETLTLSRSYRIDDYVFSRCSWAVTYGCTISSRCEHTQKLQKPNFPKSFDKLLQSSAKRL
uniref:Uncharacterized protein n=1 Tax=Engystomops pustulosus TaxID=76066 RepID=A0AAV6Z0J0_ENGPU|nr:hypothetical protein GDO81_025419 [Engystomops pustulosus]